MTRSALYLLSFCIVTSCDTGDAEQHATGIVKRATPALLSQVDELFLDYDKISTPGYAVGIVQNGELVYGKGYGAANLDYGILITPPSVFNVASLSKQFTAACVAILIQDGKISLEDPVRRFIQEFPLYNDEIRVKHLIYLTSGLKEYYTLERGGNLTWEDPSPSRRPSQEL